MMTNSTIHPITTSRRPSDKTFIFLGGLHRSGTSLLHHILRSHPEISGFENTGVLKDEGQHLQSVYPPAIDFGGPGRFGFRSAAYMTEQHALATDHSADQLWQQWSPYWDLEKPFLIEKSPPNLIRTRFLNRLFPGCKLIIILRHPIAVAYATQKWCKRRPIPVLIEHNLRCYERFLQDAPALPNLYLLRYEEFVLDPQRYTRSLLNWIGLSPFNYTESVRPNVNEKYFSKWHEATQNPIKKVLFDTASSALKFEQRAQQFGYSYQHPETLTDPETLTNLETPHAH